jgi:cytochrome c-type biogenesis protein CcmH/NrfG
VPKVAKPLPVEFLPDEFVLEDVEAYEALPDEFVVEDESTVGFAGPSDAPPRPWTPAAPAIRAPKHSLSRADTRRPRRVPTALLVAALGVAGLVATARLIGSSPPRSAPVAANSSASAPVYALAVPAEPVAPVTSGAASSGQAELPATPGEPQETSEAINTKEASQQALELGKVALATSLGERSVALDATDADSWLILGAAYLQAGDYKNARRCFASCVKQATSGARRECAAMLR